MKEHHSEQNRTEQNVNCREMLFGERKTSDENDVSGKIYQSHSRKVFAQQTCSIEVGL